MPALLIPLGAVLIGLVMLGMALSAVETQRAQDASRDQSGFSWRNALSGFFGVFGIFAIKTTQALSSILTRYAASKLGAVAHWFTALAHLAGDTARGLESFAMTVAHAMERLVTIYIPHAIAAAVHPVGLTARQALRNARRGLTLAQRAYRAAIRAGHIAAREGKWARGRLGAIARWEAWARGRIRDLTKRGNSLAHELARVRKLAAAAAIAGVVVRTLARRFPWLFCRKTKMVGQRVCGLDADLLAALLADTLLIAGTLSLVTFAKEMVTVEEEAAKIVQGFWRAT